MPRPTTERPVKLVNQRAGTLPPNHNQWLPFMKNLRRPPSSSFDMRTLSCENNGNLLGHLLESLLPSLDDSLGAKIMTGFDLQPGDLVLTTYLPG